MSIHTLLCNIFNSFEGDFGKIVIFPINFDMINNDSMIIHQSIHRIRHFPFYYEPLQATENENTPHKKWQDVKE